MYFCYIYYPNTRIMNKTMLIGCMLCLACMTGPTAMGQTNRELRYEYVMKNLKLDKQAAAQFGPLLKNYLEELKQA